MFTKYPDGTWACSSVIRATDLIKIANQILKTICNTYIFLLNQVKMKAKMVSSKYQQYLLLHLTM